MGKRLLRVFAVDISSKTDILINNKVNLVLKDKTTFFGTLIEMKGDVLIVKDVRDNTFKFNLAQISELIMDYPAPY